MKIGRTVAGENEEGGGGGATSLGVAGAIMCALERPCAHAPHAQLAHAPHAQLAHARAHAHTPIAHYQTFSLP